MRKLAVSFLALALIAGGSAARAAAAQAASQPADKTPPSYDMKAQSLLDLEDLHKKLVSLAEAIPADKFTWRPAPDVRSIAEVYLHIAGTNFDLASYLGSAPAPGFKKEGYEQSTTDKAKVVDQLNQSFAYTRAALEKMSNADYKKPMPKLGPDANLGDIVYIIMTHTHEHLGQSIAYARINGVVPPWTAEEQQRMSHQTPRPPQ
jgi:uncharacterized damage-inducible protein DinB